MSKLNLIDIHAHLDFDQFDRKHQEIIDRAKSVGVSKIINVSSSISGCEHSVSLSFKYPEIFASVGVHPHEVANMGGEQMREIMDLAKKSKKVVAIGEVGLDYKGVEDEDTRELQRKFFKIQIGISKQLKLPLIIHCRDAFKDLYEILSSQDYALIGHIHSFSGDIEEAKNVLDLGFYISFTGNITYPSNNYLREVAKFAPLDKIMVETDSPFMPPQNYRGQINEPAYVLEIAKEIAKVKNISLEEVAKKTTENAEKLFKLKD